MKPNTERLLLWQLIGNSLDGFKYHLFNPEILQTHEQLLQKAEGQLAQGMAEYLDISVQELQLMVRWWPVHQGHDKATFSFEMLNVPSNQHHVNGVYNGILHFWSAYQGGLVLDVNLYAGKHAGWVDDIQIDDVSQIFSAFHEALSQPINFYVEGY